MMKLSTLKTLGIFTWIGLVTLVSINIFGFIVLLELALFTIILNFVTFIFAKQGILYLGGKLFHKMDNTHFAHEHREEIDLYGLVNECLREHPEVFAGMTTDNDKISVYFLDNHMVKAFAMGWHKNALVCVSKGLLRAFRNTTNGVLDKAALKAVLLHELAHIRYDHSLKGFLSELLICLVRVLEEAPCEIKAKLPIKILQAFFYPLALLGASLSRQMEYEADETARHCGHGKALKRGLAIISEGSSWYEGYAVARRPWPVSIVFLILEFFDSHPNIKNRIAAIDAQERETHIAREEIQQEANMDFVGYLYSRAKNNTSAVLRSCGDEFQSYKAHFTTDKLVANAKIAI